MRFAQYGIAHDHAADKARVIRESDRLDHELTVQETLLRAIGLA